jgi:hypothetical protein
MAKKTAQQRASFLQRFWLPIILAIIALAGTMITILGPFFASRFSASAVSSPSSSFDYQVRIETRAGEPIANAAVILEIGGGKAPLDGVSDSTGLARIFIEKSFVGQPGRLIVKAPGYKTHTQNIDLTEGKLPKIVQLDSAP